MYCRSSNGKFNQNPFSRFGEDLSTEIWLSHYAVTLFMHSEQRMHTNQYAMCKILWTQPQWLGNLKLCPSLPEPFSVAAGSVVSVGWILTGAPLFYWGGRGLTSWWQVLWFPYFLLPFGVYIVKELFLCNCYNVQLIITETWSLILREEHRLEGIWEQSTEENIWTKEGSKRDQMVGSWSKLHNEELHNLYCLQNITRMIKPNVQGM
jgi:hypothetical protein